MDELVLSVSDFVAVFNQTISYAYPSVTIQGELESFRINRSKWVYFNLKDEYSSVKFFGSVNQLPGPLEDGLLVQVQGIPYLHPQYGFSINVQYMQPVGEGSLKKATQLLEAKLAKEGLFNDDRKRPIEYPPSRVGLVTSLESAAFHDFTKILAERWGGVSIQVIDVQVQGLISPSQIVEAVEHFNSLEDPLDVIVIIRGGGSADDLAAFNSELVTRAVATSRTPTLVAIGHETDLSLAEKAADKRASTPSNAAEILTPDKKQYLASLVSARVQLDHLIVSEVHEVKRDVGVLNDQLLGAINNYISGLTKALAQKTELVSLLSPLSALKRGYAIVRQGSLILTTGRGLKLDSYISTEFLDSEVVSIVKEIKIK